MRWILKIPAWALIGLVRLYQWALSSPLKKCNVGMAVVLPPLISRHLRDGSTTATPTLSQNLLFQRAVSSTFANLPGAKTTYFTGFYKTRDGVFQRELFWPVSKKYRDTYSAWDSRSTAVTKLAKVEVSPLLGQRCRFDPTCSDYFIESVRKYSD